VKFALPVRTVNQKVVVSAVFVAAMFMNIMDGTVVNVALPTLSRYFAAPIGSVSGVVTAYLVALAVATAIGALFLPGGSEHAAGRFDLPGFLLAALGFPLFLYAISVGSSSGWSSAPVVGSGVAGVVLLVAFALVEQRVSAPLLRLRIYRDRLFRITSLQLVVASGGFMGTLFLVPLLLQNGLGFSAIHSGLCTFSEALGGMTGTQVTSRLYKRVGPRRLMIAGMSASVAAIALMALAGRPDAFWLIPVLMYFTGCSFGFAMAPSLAANMAKISPAETGHASTLQNTVRQAGAAAGVALLGTVLGASGAGPHDLVGYHLAFLAAAGLMAVGVIFSAFVNDADAAATMAAVPRPGAADPLVEAA
jgi:predicted MFS family arabinose efflux permease